MADQDITSMAIAATVTDGLPRRGILRTQRSRHRSTCQPAMLSKLEPPPRVSPGSTLICQARLEHVGLFLATEVLG
jgi:hypothetical protein